MINYVWAGMLACLAIYWMIYTIADTIIVFKNFKRGYRFSNLENASQGFYFFVIAVIFFYSLFSYLLQ